LTTRTISCYSLCVCECVGVTCYINTVTVSQVTDYGFLFPKNMTVLLYLGYLYQYICSLCCRSKSMNVKLQLPYSIIQWYRYLSAALLDDEPVWEVGHELEVLLLLVHTDHLVRK
jgi:hypothetical protein